VAQYFPPVAQKFTDIATTPESLLLWFHHVPWNHRMVSGRTLWDEVVTRYNQGETDVVAMQSAWARLKPFVDAERFEITADDFAIQARDAKLWRDASIAYFQSLSGLPLPAGATPPPHSLSYYKQLEWPYAPGQGSPGRKIKPPAVETEQH
jgi:alpha-glucuronidase